MQNINNKEFAKEAYSIYKTFKIKLEFAKGAYIQNILNKEPKKEPFFNLVLKGHQK